MDQAARNQDDDSTPSGSGDLRGAAAKVVGTALAAAFVGALGGAAKALLDRRGAEAPDTDEQQSEAGDEADRPDDATLDEAAGAEHEEEQENDDQDPALVAEQGRDDEEQPAAEEHDEDEGAQRAQAEDDNAPRQQTQGVSAGESAEVVTQARRQLEGLLGEEAERVSGLERVDGGWSVMLEVVEVSRVPESTDVLATYEVALDDDRNLVSVNRRRRYRRSQIDAAS